MTDPHDFDELEDMIGFAARVVGWLVIVLLASGVLLFWSCTS